MTDQHEATVTNYLDSVHHLYLLLVTLMPTIGNFARIHIEDMLKKIPYYVCRLYVRLTLAELDSNKPKKYIQNVQKDRPRKRMEIVYIYKMHE